VALGGVMVRVTMEGGGTFIAGSALKASVSAFSMLRNSTLP
jgi:hypothetical protein